jgi:hypothetical protein
LIFAIFSLRFNYGVAPPGLSERGMSYRGFRGAGAPLHPRLLMVSPLRGFLHTTTYTTVGYIVADEKLNFLPKDLLNNFYYKRTGKVAATWYVIDVFQNKEKAYHVNKVKLC